jgi:hypothetical protein
MLVAMLDVLLVVLASTPLELTVARRLGDRVTILKVVACESVVAWDRIVANN